MSEVTILGAGIAGLSTGWLLQKRGVDFTILERSPHVGGLARSFQWHGFFCDFAAHRLFSSNDEILQNLLSLVPMGRQARRSQIYLRGHWMRDPLDVLELASKLSISERIQVLWSFQSRPRRLPDGNFENYVLRRYGKDLYHFFFQPYTEKLFGIPGNQISVLWAKQKVRLANPLDSWRENTKNKFQYFFYPVQGGYGAIANSLYEEINGRVVFEANVNKLESVGDKLTAVHYTKDGQHLQLPAQVVVSTLPLNLTSRMLGQHVELNFQKVDAVYLWINRPLVTDFHWIYFIDGDIAINRMVEFKNMSAVGAPQETTVLCAEVTQDHPDVVSKVIEDLVRTGLIHKDEVLDSLTIREEFAYPVYNVNYEKAQSEAQIKIQRFENLYLVGRAAEFRHREVDDNFEAASITVEQILRDTEMISKVHAAQPIPQIIGRKSPQIQAVILTLNNYQDTYECLQSVLASDYSGLRLVVVDNGSNDQTPQKIRGDFRTVDVIENGQNLGVPAAFNVGVIHALKQKADYILLLNNDTIVAPDMITRLMERAESDLSTAIVMPKVLFYGSEDRVWSSGGYHRAFPPKLVYLKGKDANKTHLIQFAPSCGLLIHRRAFEQVGLLDPGYFFYHEDTDFCERVREHGLNIWYEPTGVMWHKVSKTTRGALSSLSAYTSASSMVRYYRRHGRPALLSVFIHVSYELLLLIALERNLAQFPEFLRGVRDGLQKPLGNYPRLPRN